MAMKPLVPASSRRDPPYDRTQSLLETLQYNITLPTILLIGATLQILITVIFPFYLAILPTLSLILYRLTHTLLITYNLIPNPYLKDSITGKTTAVPFSTDGAPSQPGNENIAILHLAAKSNHPLGVFAKDMDIIGELTRKMNRELEQDVNGDNGFLGQTSWTRPDVNGATELLFISYWRSADHVHRYAHSPLHREAWRYWEKTIKEHRYIGLMHEVFEAPAGAWESVYLNFQPTLLGSTTYLKRADGKVEGGTLGKEWLNPLVDANRGSTRTSMGRRGLNDKKERIGDMFDENPYA